MLLSMAFYPNFSRELVNGRYLWVPCSHDLMPIRASGKSLNILVGKQILYFFQQFVDIIELRISSPNMAKNFQENVDKLLECPICLERIKKPKMLNCQHSFCSDCLKNIAQKHGTSSYSLECAVCGKKCKFEHLKKIPENLHLKNLLDIKSAEEQNKTHEMGKYYFNTYQGWVGSIFYPSGRVSGFLILFGSWVFGFYLGLTTFAFRSNIFLKIIYISAKQEAKVL